MLMGIMNLFCHGFFWIFVFKGVSVSRNFLKQGAPDDSMKKLVLLICVLVLIVGCNPTFDGPTKFNPQDPNVGTPKGGTVSVPGEATLLISPIISLTFI